MLVIDGGMRAAFLGGRFKSTTAWAGIVVRGGSRLVLAGTVFHGNQMCQGVLRCSHKSTVTINDASFVDNTGWENGAALYLEGCAATISGSVLTGDVAGLHGGAVWADDGSTVHMAGTRLADNTARKGGAVAMRNSSMTMTGCVLDHNNARTMQNLAELAKDDGHYELGVGGAVYCVNSNVTMEETNLTHNTAVMNGGKRPAAWQQLPSPGSSAVTTRLWVPVANLH